MFEDLIGSRVSWEKIEGEPSTHMAKDVRFGTLQVLGVGERLVISGDNGILATRVKDIEWVDAIIKVRTANSVYWLGKW